MKNNKNNIIVKFIKIDKNEITISESRTKEFVNYGNDNNLPQLFTDFYKDVSLHTGIINKKINMIKAGGLYSDKDSKQLNDFLDNFSDSDTIDDLFEKIITDIVIYNGTYLQIVWSKDGKTINKIEHMPYNTIRAEKADSDGNINNYFYNSNRQKTKKWTKYTQTSDYQTFKAFGNKDKKKPQIFYIKRYNPITFYYSLPDYVSSVIDLDTFKSIGEFHNSLIHNGMQPGFIIMFKGPTPSTEKQDAIIKQLKDRYSDVQNAGKPMVFFLDGDEIPSLEMIEKNDADEMFKTLYDNTVQNIITAHQIPRILANVQGTNNLGSGKEYLEAESIFNDEYIKPIQNLIIQNFNIILNINKLENLKFRDTQPNINTYNIDDLLKLYSVDEVKDLLNLPKKINNNYE